MSPIFWSETGNDARVLYAAGRVAANHGNPYDFNQLSAEASRVNAEAHAAGTGRDAFGPNEYHYPPILTRAWQALAPLGDVGFLVIDVAVLLIAGIIGLELILAALNWEQRWLPRLFFLFSLPMLTVLSSGNPATLLLLGWAAAFFWAARGRFLLAGGALAIAWIKPPVGIPIAVAMLIANWQQWRRLLAGVAAGSLVFAALNLALGGLDGTRDWILSLVQFSATINAHQDAVIQQRFLAGLSGPFFGLGPLWANLIAVVLVGLILLWIFRRAASEQWSERKPRLVIAIAMAVALAVSPYIHTYDLVLEAVPVLVLAGLASTALDRLTLTMWALAPALNLAVVLLVVAITGRLDTPWSFAVALNALTLLALAAAAVRHGRTANLAGQAAVA
jgi:hypothetical protein